MGLLEQYNSHNREAVHRSPQILDVGDENPGFIIQFTVKVSGGDLKLKHAKMILTGVGILFIVGSILFFRLAFLPAPTPPAGFEGNIPNTSEYKPPPTPTEVQVQHANEE